MSNIYLIIIASQTSLAHKNLFGQYSKFFNLIDSISTILNEAKLEQIQKQEELNKATDTIKKGFITVLLNKISPSDFDAANSDILNTRAALKFFSLTTECEDLFDLLNKPVKFYDVSRKVLYHEKVEDTGEINGSDLKKFLNNEGHNQHTEIHQLFIMFFYFGKICSTLHPVVNDKISENLNTKEDTQFDQIEENSYNQDILPAERDGNNPSACACTVF